MESNEDFPTNTTTTSNNGNEPFATVQSHSQ